MNLSFVTFFLACGHSPFTWVDQLMLLPLRECGQEGDTDSVAPKNSFLKDLIKMKWSKVPVGDRGGRSRHAVLGKEARHARKQMIYLCNRIPLKKASLGKPFKLPKLLSYILHTF